jgi:hypothetical protein
MSGRREGHRESVDLGQMSYEEWLAFVTSGPTAEQPAGDEWYWKHELVVSDPRRLISHFRLFCDSMGAVEKQFSLQKVNEVIWMHLGSAVLLGSFLLERRVPLRERLGLIDAMYRVYRDFVSGHPAPEMANGFYMWWELILAGLTTAGANLRDADGRIILDEVRSVLTRLAFLGDARCQQYALHGLGHAQAAARDEQVTAVFDCWLSEHAHGLDEETVAWVRHCRDGTVQ